MRVLALFAAGAGAAALAATAAADTVPLPPVPGAPTVTVAVPATPVPLPAVPKLPTPAVAVPAQPVPSASAVQTLVSSAQTLSGGTSSPVGGSFSAPAGAFSAPAGGGSSSASTSASGARVDHFHSSRPWIGTTGSTHRRTTTFTFVLQHAGPVVFTLNQVSPACVGIGRFTVSGHPGLNRVRFAGVVRGRKLGPGTYRVAIRTSSGRLVRRVTLVVVGGSAPSHEELRLLRRANTCRGAGTTSAAYTRSVTTAAVPLTPKLPSQPTAQAPRAGGLAPQGPNLHSGVLSSSVEKTARAIQPLLVALLAASILLLGLASLPREAVPGPRLHDALARHRLELAGLGITALVAVALAILLS